MDARLRREDLVFPELGYRIVGVVFDVYGKLGYGHAEKTYQRALALGLRNAGLEFREQVYVPVMYENERVGINYLDFLVEGKIVLEIKQGSRFIKAHIEQVYRYLVANKLKLGILAYFAPRSAQFKRIVNLR